MKTPSHLNRARRGSYVITSSLKPQKNPRPPCPHCASRYVVRFAEEGLQGTPGSSRLYECKKCGTRFSAATLKEKEAEEITKGSGNIAVPRGPIEMKPLRHDMMALMRLNAR